MVMEAKPAFMDSGGSFEAKRQEKQAEPPSCCWEQPCDMPLNLAPNTLILAEVKTQVLTASTPNSAQRNTKN